MSRRRCAGFLEGMNRVVQNIVSQERLKRPVVHDIASAIKEFVDIQLQPGVFEDPHGPAFVQFNQHVDVALRTGFPARDRAEHSGVRYATPPQIILMNTENLKHVLKNCRHLFTTSLPDGYAAHARQRYPMVGLDGSSPAAGIRAPATPCTIQDAAFSKYNSRRPAVQAATTQPKKPVSWVQIGRPIAMADAKILHPIWSIFVESNRRKTLGVALA
jgi:hypothetical protein